MTEVFIVAALGVVFGLTLFVRKEGVNTKQKSVLVLGALLLLLNFVFPYTQYPVEETSEGGMSVRTDTTFMPIWSAREAHERAPLKGNPWSDTIVLWGMVAKFAGGIVPTDERHSLQLCSQCQIPFLLERSPMYVNTLLLLAGSLAGGMNIPFNTRRSSTRGTPRGLFGNKG